MLVEMEQALGRLQSFGLSSSWAVQNFGALHKLFRRELERIRSCEQCPRVMRILAEECVECAEDYLDRLGVGTNDEAMQNRPYWPHYLSGVESGALLGDEINRYLKAKNLADLFLKQSYLPDEGIMEYKRERYAYALSVEPLPEWFIPTSVCGWLEEIITAYCFLWFAVVDYAEETYCGKGA